jgi:cytochrome c oxidase subunit I
MYQGSISTEVPFLWSASFIFIFMIGGFTGLVLGALATNVHLHDTAFVVAHFHFIVFGGAGFAFFGRFITGSQRCSAACTTSRGPKPAG